MAMSVYIVIKKTNHFLFLFEVHVELLAVFKNLKRNVIYLFIRQFLSEPLTVFCATVFGKH